MSDPTTFQDGFTSVGIGEIEAEVSRQLRLEQDPDGPPIQKSRMSNLVVYCDQADQVAPLLDEVGEIIEVHPARVLFLSVDPSGGSDGVEAGVRVRTRYVRGGRQEVGSEIIMLRAGGRAADRLPYLVRGLLIGDLPANLWWASRQPPCLAGPLLYDLTEQVQQLIYDSLGWIDPHRGMSGTSGWLARFERDGRSGPWRVASDVNWRRLKTWRRLIAQALDPATAPGAIESIHEILIEHGPHSVTKAWELASWLSARLGWSVRARTVELGVEIGWDVHAPWGPVKLVIRRLPDGPPVIQRMRICCVLSGEPGALVLLNDQRSRLTAVPEGKDVALRTVSIKPLPHSELVGRQLVDRERDPVFAEAMGIAQVLAQGVG